MTIQPLAIGIISSQKDLDLYNQAPQACGGVEIRLDLLEDSQVLKRFEENRPPSTRSILTLRGLDERGQSSLTAEERWEHLKPLLKGHRYFDFEINSLNTELAEDILASKGDSLLIGSYHNFEKTPSLVSLKAITEKGLSHHCDIIKMAVEIESLEDIERLGSLFSLYPNTSFSLMGMGPLGGVSRHYFIEQGSVLNYGFLGDASKAVVKGQLPASTLQSLIQLYRP